MLRSLEPPTLRQVSPTEVDFRGRRLSYFGGSDYFRLSWHPQVRAAIVTTLTHDGHNVAASRMTTGNHPIYDELERALAKFFGFPAAVVTATGYAAPLVAAQALAGVVTHVIVDQRAHSCLKDAARLSGAKVIFFAHRELASLVKALRSGGRDAKPVVFTDGLSPLDGSVPPLAEYLAVLPANALLLVDDAHGVGTLGQRGRGVLDSLCTRDPRVLLTLTMSKALGAYGGAVLAPAWLRKRIIAHSAIHAGGTPLPPPLTAAGLTALKLLRNSGRILRARLDANTHSVKEAFRATHPDWLERPGPTFTVSFREPRQSEQLRRRLLAAGIYPTLIRYRNGPAEAFFRLAIASEHTPSQITTLREVLAEFAKYAV